MTHADDGRGHLSLLPEGLLLRIRDRMTSLVAAAMIGFPIAIAVPASAHAGMYSSESLAVAAVTNIEFSPAPVATDPDLPFPAEASALAARQERTPALDTLPSNDVGAAATRARLTEHIALLALGLLSVGAGIVTVTAEKRKMSRRVSHVSSGGRYEGLP